MSILFMLGGTLALLCALGAINRYLSFKLHRSTYPLTLSLISFNMMILLSTTYLLPLDLFYTAELNNEQISDHDEGSPFTNTTGVVSLSQRGFLSDLVSIGTSSDNEMQRHNFIFIWLLIYWIQFFLCWFAIPVLISYLDLKYAIPIGDIAGRIKKALYQNLKFYLIFLVGIVSGFVYLIFSTGSAHGDLKSLLISLAHLYSLSYTLLLLATGLVMLPMDLLALGRMPTDQGNNQLYVQLSKLNDEMNDAYLTMMDNSSAILNTNEISYEENGFNEVLETCKADVKTLIAELGLAENRTYDGAEVSITDMDKLNATYNKFLTHYFDYLYSKNHSDQVIHKLAHSQSSSVSIIEKVGVMTIGAATACMSLLIGFLEIVPTKWAHDWFFVNASWTTFLLTFFIISYNTLVSLYALSKIKFSSFHLTPNGRSNPSNALYYSLHSSRLLFPICFNLMSLIPDFSNNEGYKSSFESSLYDDLTVIPLVNILNNYAPMLFMIFVPISFIYDLKRKILLKVLGEEYYYQFFGMMLYEPVTGPTSEDTGIDEDRGRMEEDYAFSLQDGRYIFERASSQNLGPANS